jgi:hypothetical protein
MQKPPASSEKNKLIAGLIQVRGEILAAAESLPADKHEQVYLGEWSVMDMLAHLEGWDEANRQAVEQILAGNLPAFYASADKNWKSFNAELVKRHKQPNLWEMLQSAHQSHVRLISALIVVPPAQWDRDRGLRYKGWKVTIGRLMRVELGDELEHLEQLVDFAG